jgi:hypothetical protein
LSVCGVKTRPDLHTCVALLDFRATAPTNSSADHVIAQQILDRAGESGWVVRLDRQSIRAVVDNHPDPWDVAGN